MNRERVKRKYAQMTMEELEEWQAKDKRKYAQLTAEELEERHAQDHKRKKNMEEFTQS